MFAKLKYTDKSITSFGI